MNRYLLFFSLALLSACAPVAEKTLPIPQPLRAPLAAGNFAFTNQTQEANQARRFEAGPLPLPPGQTDFVISPGSGMELPKFAVSQPIQINIAEVPLPAFINEVFGNLLGLSFQIAPALQNKTDLVTLRVPKAMQPVEIYRLAKQVLSSYGVGVIQEGGLLGFVPQTAQAAGAEESPLLVSGRTLPEVPDSHRTVFQVVPLVALRQMEVARLLGQIYQQPGLSIREDAANNTILLSGPPALVGQVAKAIRLLDQPFMQGRHALRLQPAFLGAQKLADQLLNVLKAEGYHVGIGVSGMTPAILLLPVQETNSVFAFTRDGAVLGHVREWAETLDTPGHLTDKGGLFFYPLQNAPAADIVKTITPLLGGISGDPQAAAAGVVVDQTSNTLLYQGNAETWARLLPVIQALDQPAKLVLIEVTIAEVLLNNEERFGIEWLLQNSPGSGYSNELGTLGGLGLASAGFSYSLLNGLGQARAVLNAFASNSRINVLSSPRLMLKSGSQANINVGSDVPIVTSQSVAADGAQTEGNSAIMQQIQYRKTGITLDVKAIAHAGNRVDLDIAQSVSQAEPNTVSDISSPVILNRSINTSITLSDGGSVLLGGLIRDSRTKGDSGVPGLSEIPLLGSLFRVDRENYERTELVILIVPYVINNDGEARAITEAFRQRLTWDAEAPAHETP